ncbi:MAG: hypothetical protein KAI79_08325 [Bacteroidales bacterium]|nr:hypothetical protein [Bacteroidales bacterium]
MMREFPVKQLTASQLEIGGKLLINQNDELLFDGKVIANYEDLTDIFIVSDDSEFNTLSPKIGDVAKITDSGETFIWNGVWVPIYKDKIEIFIVNSSSELGPLSPKAGDLVQITSEIKTAIYSGEEWVDLLSEIGELIDDLVVEELLTWSSTKISDELTLKQDSIIAGDALSFTNDTLNIDLSEGLDMEDENLINAKLVSFSPIFDNGVKIIDWELSYLNGVYQKVTINADCTLTLLEPHNPCTYYLHIYQGSQGNAKLNLPVLGWSNGLQRTITPAANTGHDLLMVHYYGNNLYVFEMLENII